MKFSAQEQIDAPAHEVFARISNADRFEDVLRSRGGQIARSPANSFDVGTAWDSRVKLRGKTRKVMMELTELTPGERMVFVGGTSGMDMTVMVDTAALTPARTRLRVQLEAKPKTLAARLLVQSAKLAKGRLDDRFKQRFSTYAQKMFASD